MTPTFLFYECFNYVTVHDLHSNLTTVVLTAFYYIMPPIPGPPAGIAGVSSLMVATTDSVVSSVDATLVAF